MQAKIKQTQIISRMHLFMMHIALSINRAFHLV